MNIKVFQNRKIEKDYFYNEGTQNENKSTVLTFEVPLGYEDFSKRIVFITEDGNFWDYIPENEYEIKNNITKYETVEAYLWLTKDDQDFRSQNFELNFYDNENADDMTPSEEQVDGFNTLIAELELKIEEVDDLKKETLQALEDLKNQQIDYERRFEEMNNMIKEIQETNEYQSEIIDQFKNEFKQITVSGDSIYIPDAAELPMELIPYGEPVQEVIPEELGTTVEGESVVVADGNPEKEVKATVNGNSKQETTEGYNLLQVNETNWELTDKGIKNLKQNAGFKLTKDDINLKANTTYYFNFVLLSRPTSATTFTTQIDDVQNNNLTFLNIEQESHFTIGKVVTKTYTPTKDEVLDIKMWGNANSDIFEFQYWITTDSTKKTYEPYTNGVATPNTNHKQPIEVITECSLVQRGKNLLNDEVYKGKSITTSFILQDNKNPHILTTHKFKKDKFYKFNILFTDGTMINKTDWNVAIAFYNANKTSVCSIPVYGAYDISSYDLDSIRYLRVITNPSGKASYGHKTIQAITLVELDNSTDVITLEDFEPYIEPIVHEIDLAGNSLAKVGEIADLLNIGVDGSVKIEKKTIFDSFNDWSSANVLYSYNFGDFIRYMLVNNTNKKLDTNTNPLYSNYFRNINKRWGTPTEIGLFSWEDNKQYALDLPNTYADVNSVVTLLNSLEDFKILTQLAEQYYETISLPSIEPITLFEGTNVFELVTNLGTTMALTYDYVTPSPSIDRPSEIFTVQGSYRTEKVNENFLPLNYESNSITQNGVTVSFNKSTGKFKVTGKATTDTWFNIYPIFKAGTNENDAGEPINALNKYLVTNTKKWGMNDSVILTLGATLSDTTANYKQITRETVKRGYLYFPKTDKEINTEFWLMICDDYNQDTYIQHQSTILPLTVGNELLGEIVTLTEEEAKQLNLDGAGKYRRTDYGRYVFTGDERWSETNVNRFAIFNFYREFINNSKSYCNKAIQSFNWAVEENTCAIMNGNFYFNNLVGYTIDEFKALLKEWYDNGEPMEAIYELAKPTYEKITDETELQQLSAYDKQIAFFGINNINTYPTDDLVKAPLKIHATYSKSNKLTIQSLEDRLASLESQVTNLQDNQI